MVPAPRAWLTRTSVMGSRSRGAPQGWQRYLRRGLRRGRQRPPRRHRAVRGECCQQATNVADAAVSMIEAPDVNLDPAGWISIECRPPGHMFMRRRKVTGESGPGGRLSPGRRRTYVLLKRLAPEVHRWRERWAAISRWDVAAGGLRGDGTYRSPAESSPGGGVAPDNSTSSTIASKRTPLSTCRVATLEIACASSSAGHGVR